MKVVDTNQPLSIPKIRSILTSHSIAVKETSDGNIYGDDSYTYLDYKHQICSHSEWVDMTHWTLKQVGHWLGY